MTRLGLWIFAFSPTGLLLLPPVQQTVGDFALLLMFITIPVAVVGEVVLLRRRRAKERAEGTPRELIPSTPLGNWFAKLFAYLFAAMCLLLVIREVLG